MIDYDHEKECYIIPTPEEIFERLRKFFEVKKESTGGWAPVENDEVATLADIFNDIIHNKYEMDPDGDVPINFRLIDRTKYEPMHYYPLRYSHHAKTLEELVDIAEEAEYNLSIAFDKVKNSFRSIKWFLEESKKQPRSK
jgi:hypothetical protein